jgi:hypothetical protein
VKFSGTDFSITGGSVSFSPPDGVPLLAQLAITNAKKTMPKIRVIYERI